MQDAGCIHGRDATTECKNVGKYMHLNASQLGGPQGAGGSWRFHGHTDIVGRATPFTCEDPAFTDKTDHRPVYGLLKLDQMQFVPRHATLFLKG